MENKKKKKKRPRDINELAAMIVGEATGEPGGKPGDDVAETPEKNPNAVALGKLGGKKGGKARAEKLTPEERKEIARLAAHARWKKSEL
jgi:hypothetical protein